MTRIKQYSTNNKIELNKEKVSAYVCGPTVYGSVHIGNIRPILTIDIFAKALKATGKELDLVHNITDIDDKIITKAKELNISEDEVSKQYTKEYLDLLNQLNIDSIKYMPKVTENLEEMIELIQTLIDNGYAYESNGSVYFRVNKVDDYGVQHKVSVDELESEKEEDTEKENPADFALWKNTDEGITWKSPWSEGRPGWHTECVTFINDYFGGDTIDIHGGGIDLRFPHHTNEDAQFKGLTGKKLSEAYSYVGHISMDGDKMSKSLGNIILAKDFIKEYGTAVLRYALISTNYSKPLNFNEDLLNNSIKEVTKIENALNKGIEKIFKSDIYTENKDSSFNKIVEFILDDIDTVSALTELNQLIKFINGQDVDLEYVEKYNALIESLKVLGFKIESNINDDIRKEYKAAFDNQDYETADKIREEINIKIK